MVMRHGLRREDSDHSIEKEEISSSRLKIPGDKLGCYFCSDVVAPGDVSKVGCKCLKSQSYLKYIVVRRFRLRIENPSILQSGRLNLAKSGQ